jgi:hypothetical protein
MTKYIKFIGLISFFVLLGGGIIHGQFHSYNSTIPHVHPEAGTIHLH